MRHATLGVCVCVRANESKKSLFFKNMLKSVSVLGHLNFARPPAGDEKEKSKIS